MIAGARPFTLDRLRALFKTAPRDTFWRHDVDVSLSAARSMAELENKLEIHATYYLMTTTPSPFYTFPEALELATLLEQLGHQVGSHIDMRRLPQAKLEFITGPVSFHCPTPDLLWREFDGFESTYGPDWFAHYLSDSRGEFSYGDPEDAFESEPGQTWQVNLHPEWWFEPEWPDNYPVSVENAHEFFAGWMAEDRA